MMQECVTLVLCSVLKDEQTILYMAGIPDILYGMKVFGKSYENYGLWKCDFCLGTVAFYFSFLERKHLTICN
jgi:hypothetical protein